MTAAALSRNSSPLRALTAQDLVGMLRARRSGAAGWTARGPVPTHGKGRGDRTPALSIAEGRDGRVLLHCFAGCAADEIVAAIGVRLGDLMGDSAPRGGERRVQRPLTEITPEELQLGQEILLQLWTKAVEVRVSPDHLRLVVTPPSRVPDELMHLARAHEIAVMSAVEAIDGRPYTTAQIRGRDRSDLRAILR